MNRTSDFFQFLLRLPVPLYSFFASVEVREKPELSGLPVVVGADPKRGKGRGVVCTCSCEAREDKACRCRGFKTKGKRHEADPEN